jgi:uncharacterized membrane protein
MMMGSMGLMMFLGMVALFTLIAAAVYVGVRFARGTGLSDSARATLDHRFASGEISVEDYHERESALRSASPGSGKGRRGLAGS